MRRPKHTTPPKHLNIVFNPATGLYDVSERRINMEEVPVYSMPLELIRVLAKYYRYKNCGPNIPRLHKFYNDLNKAERAQVVTTIKKEATEDDFFPDPEWD